MIPTLIVFGLVFGRWWRFSLVAAALGWPALLLATGVMSVGWGLFGAAALAVVNAGVGVLVNLGVRVLVRGLRRVRASHLSA